MAEAKSGESKSTPRKIYDRAEARRMRDAGLSYRVLAAKFGVSVSTLHKDWK